MGRKEKRLEKFLSSPQNFNYYQIEKILIDNGFQKINAKGSHNKFKHSNLDSDLIIPVHNQDCKIFYKNYAAKYLRHLLNHSSE